MTGEDPPVRRSGLQREDRTGRAVRTRGPAQQTTLPDLEAGCIPWTVVFSVGPGDPPMHWGMTTAPLPLARRTQTRHSRPRQSQDRPGSTDRDMDKLGRRDARRRLGGARRAVDLGGDRRLSNRRSPVDAPGRSARRPRRLQCGAFLRPDALGVTCGRHQAREALSRGRSWRSPRSRWAISSLIRSAPAPGARYMRTQYRLASAEAPGATHPNGMMTFPRAWPSFSSGDGRLPAYTFASLHERS